MVTKKYIEIIKNNLLKTRIVEFRCFEYMSEYGPNLNYMINIDTKLEWLTCHQDEI